jgi:hypothetical protein
MTKNEIFLLYSRMIPLLEDEADEQEMADLLALVKKDAEARKYYFRLLNIHSQLSSIDSSSILEMLEENEDDTTVFTDSKLWDEVLEEQRRAEALPRKQKEEPSREEPCDLKHNKLSKPLVWIASGCAAAILFFVVYANLFYRPVAASVSDNLGATWSKSDYAIGNPVRTGSYLLSEGLLKLTFNSGAAVFLEGPAQFRIESDNSMKMEYGKVSANVPRQASGFTIITKSKVFRDIGTQFGLILDEQQNCEMRVFKGVVALDEPGEKIAPVPQRVNSLEAVAVNGESGAVKVAEYCGLGIVRDFDSKTGQVWRGEKFNLAEALDGSRYGQEELAGMALNPASGKYESYSLDNTYSQGNMEYHKVEENRFVDGVFVPGSDKNQIINSAGDTSGNAWRAGNTYWTDISTFDKVQVREEGKYWQYLNSGFDEPHIFMHANSAITFDLDAIRAEYPNLRAASFETTYTTDRARKGTGAIKYWVYIDGKLIAAGRQPGTKEILVEQISHTINDSDRFLTLVVSDGEDKTSYDWVEFVNPVITLELKTNN